MKTNHTPSINRLCAFVALIAAVTFCNSASASGTSAMGTIRYNGTDFEGRKLFQLEWAVAANGVYLVQSADDLSSGGNWQTVDAVTSPDAGPIKWMSPEASQSQEFYRLVLPQAQIFSVEPAVIAPGVAVDFYVLGQGFGSNVVLQINGVTQSNAVVVSSSAVTVPSFTPDVAGTYLVSLVINGVVVSSFNVTCADALANPELVLQGPPTEPPASAAETKANEPTLTVQIGYVEFASVIGGGGGNPDAPDADNDGLYFSKRGYDYYQSKSSASFDVAEGKKGLNAVNVKLARTAACAGITGGDDCDDTDNAPSNAREYKPKSGSILAADFNYRSSAGSWVAPYSGEVQACAMDMVIPGRGLDFIWARTYNSRIGRGSAPNGWTFSYDVHIQPFGGDIVIHDGTGRADTFFLQTNGIYTCPEFFREGTLTSGVFRLTFADTGYWEFNALDGSATAGKLSKIVDRNGNTMSLNYDGSGLLTQIVDDLERTNIVAYDLAGRVDSVTDFSGRVVRYEYDGNGDLAACVSPAVTGTPTGNDFPGGKTNRYTYSSGLPDESENHLLESVTDANGQTTLQYIYQHNQTDLEFLHCISIQRWTNTPATLSYLPQTPTPANQFAVLRCVMNDPEGNVTECFYDARNRCVTERDFTGRATPGVAVTDVDNRPAGKLRASDPDYYETQWTWNDDSLCTRVTSPGGNSQEMVYQRAFNQNSSRSNKLHDGDLRVIHEYTADGQAVDLDGDGVADTAERVWRFEYDPRFGTVEDRYLLGLREYDPIKSYLVGDSVIYNSAIYVCRSGIDDWGIGDWAIFNGTEWQKVDNTDSIISNTRQRVLDIENVLKNLGLLTRTSGDKRFGIGDTSPASPLGRKGWDGTIKGRMAGGSALPRTEIVKKIWASFITSATDPRGNVTTGSYDTNGNLTRCTGPFIVGNDPPKVEFAYNSQGEVTVITNAPDANGRRRVDTAGWQLGQLDDLVIDAGAGGLNLHSTFEHDARGNVTRCVDARGNDWLYTYNALDQCVRCESPTNLTTRCLTDFFYDAANNVQDAIMELRDDTDTKVGEQVVHIGHDPLHRPAYLVRSVDASHSMTNDFVYDGNDQCVQVLGGDAVSGVDPHQTMSYEYDERGLLFRAIAAAGSSLAATNEFDYDANGNTARVNKIDSFTIKQNVISRDGFDRPASITDPMGNETDCFYDANDNLKTVRVMGETNDVPGSAGNIRLAEARFDYDGLDRCIRAHELHFNPATQLSVGDGERTTTFAYAPNGQCMTVIDDLSHTTMFGYDTAGRSTSASSPDGKSVVVAVRDAFGNVTSSTQTDTPDLGGAPQVFSRTYVYDSLNRCVSTTDNVGNNENWSFDSLNRVAQSTDARGNHSFYEYDLLGRCTLAVRDLDGDGVPDLAHDISSSSVWSSSSGQLLAAIDSHGNTTSYGYDSLSRCTSVTNADDTRVSLIWSPRSNLIQETDANGTVVLHTYDLNDRCISNNITPGAGVASTTLNETFAYDGASRLVSFKDEDCDGRADYDSLGNCVSETRNGLATASTYDSLGNRLSLTYPGGRALTYAYDVLNQCANIVESSKSLASFSYAGPGRVARVSYGNGASADVTYDGLAGSPNASGDFGFGQISSVTHAAAGELVSVDLKWDRNGNKTLRTDTIFAPAIPRTNDLGLVYDAANRLTQATLLSGPALLRNTTYGLDRMGNRTNVMGAACSGDYTLDDSALGPLDFQMNQYTATPCDSRTYDDNGNLLGRSSPVTGPVSYQYDYADRLVQVQSVDFSSGLPTFTTSTYAYDALGRRISKSVSSGGLPPVTNLFLYDGGNVIEERENGAVTATFVLDGTRSQDDGVVETFSWTQVRGHSRCAATARITIITPMTRATCLR